jgi:hypothetical protein
VTGRDARDELAGQVIARLLLVDALNAEVRGEDGDAGA